MTTQTEPDTKTALQRFTVQDGAIAKMREQYMPLVIEGVDDKAGEKRVHDAKMVVVRSRTSTEKVAKELNAEARDWISRVNGEKNRIIGLLEPIEDHLKAEERRIESEREAIRFKAQREAEEKKRLEEEAERARIKAEQDAENARLAAERAELKRQAELMEAERKRQEEAHAVEAARLKAEQDKIEAANRAEAAKLAAERKAIEDSRRKIEEAAERERQRIADAEASRLRKIEDDAKPKPVNLGLSFGFIDEAMIRKEELRPHLLETITTPAPNDFAPSPFLREDRDKLLAVASCVAGISVPAMASNESLAAAGRISQLLDKCAADIRDTVYSMLPMPVAPESESTEDDDSAPF